MRVTRRLTIVSLLVAFTICLVSTGTASAKPDNPFASITASDAPGSPYRFVKNSGTVTRVSTTGNTVRITVTAPDRADCNGAVGAFTADYLIANIDRSSTLPPVDLPGPDGFESISPTLLGSKYYEVIPPERRSPVTVVAPLSPGTYTAVTYCTYITDAGEVDYTKSGTYYLDEFTIPSATTPPTSPVHFGSS